MTFLRLVVFYLFCVTAHWWLGTHFAPAGITPSILLAATVAVAVAAGPLAAHAFGFMCGVYLDFAAPHLFGGYALAFTIGTYLIWFFKWRMDFSNPASQMVLAFMLTILTGVIYGAAGMIFMNKFIWRGWAYTIFMPFANAVIAPVFFACARLLALDSEGND
jgi:rod shape-determining protein MreD